MTQAHRFSNIVEWLTKAKNKPKNLSLQTNGSSFNDKILSNLISMDTVFNISVEGGTNRTTKKIRGLALDTLERQIKKINKLRKDNQSKAKIVLSFTAMRSNIEELVELVEFAEIFGVDEVNVMYLLPATKAWNIESIIHCVEFSNQIIEDALSFSDAWKVNLIAPLIKEIENTPCEKPWHSISINGEGDVRFCCLDDSPIIGNLMSDCFIDIWNGPLSQKVRSEVNTKDAPSGCSSCVVRNIPYVSVSSLRKSLI